MYALRAFWRMVYGRLTFEAATAVGAAYAICILSTLENFAARLGSARNVCIRSSRKPAAIDVADRFQKLVSKISMPELWSHKGYAS
jgi:hypothetical protein